VGREPGRIGDGRRERKGWEAGVLGRPESFILKYFQEQEAKMFFDLHLAYFETSRPAEKRRKFDLVEKNRPISGKIGNLCKVATSSN